MLRKITQIYEALGNTEYSVEKIAAFLKEMDPGQRAILRKYLPRINVDALRDERLKPLYYSWGATDPIGFAMWFSAPNSWLPDDASPMSLYSISPIEVHKALDRATFADF